MSSATRVMRSAPSPQLDELVALAAKLCRAPAALLTILNQDTVWIRASAGIAGVQPFPAHGAICADVVAGKETIVTTFRRDWTDFTFYAGAPVNVNGVSVGALCVLDSAPRDFSEEQRDALESIARAASGILAGHEALSLSDVDREAMQVALDLTDTGLALFRLPHRMHEPIVEYANEAVLRRAGLPLDGSSSNAEFLRCYRQANMLPELFARARRGDERPVDHRAPSDEGTWRWYEAYARPLTPGEDGSERFAIFSRDVTRRTTAESFRHLLSEAIEQTPESVHIVRMDGDNLHPQIIYANTSFTKLTGYNPSIEYPKILGAQSNLDGIRDAVHSVMSGGTTEGETMLYRKDGSSFLAAWRAHPVDAPERHAVIIIRDVTEDRRRERELGMLSAAIEEAGDFLIVVDDTPPECGGPQTVFVNRALQEATGFAEAELTDYTIFISPENGLITLDTIKERIASGIPDYREILLRRKDGSDFWVEYTARSFVDPETKRTLRFAVGRDITTRRRSFNQIALLLAATQHSSDAIALYEPRPDGTLELTYENDKHEALGSARLLDLWTSQDRSGEELRAALEAGEEVRQIIPELDAKGLPRLVHFGARSIRNASRLEAIATLERVLTEAHDTSEDDAQDLLLRVTAMLPALIKADSSDQRFAILRAMLLATFGAELQEDEVSFVRPGVQLSSSNSARFRLRNRSYRASWPQHLSPMALTALRLCIEAAIDEEHRRER